MLSPQEINDRVFDRAVFGGYDAKEVDEFLEVLQEDDASLYRENAVLKSKMKVLVEKLEQYRAEEGNIRDTLSNAQQKSEDMFTETREKCRKLTRETEEKAKKIIADAQAKAAAEERRIASIAADCDQFIAAIRKVMDKQNEYLNELAKTGDQVRAEHNIKRQAPQSKKPAEKKPQPAPKKPQPEIKFASDDSADTETAERINNMVSSILNEKKAAPVPQEPTTVINKQPRKTASADEKFDFKNMKFN